MVVTAWSKNDLSKISDYRGPDNHKPKMVISANGGIIACGGFYHKGTAMYGLAYFPNVKNMRQSPSINTLDNFKDNVWPNTNGSYAQAISNRTKGGWILAGQTIVGNTKEKDLSAMIVTTDDYKDFNVIATTEPLGGKERGAVDQDYAKYVIQLDNGNYALIGRADWTGNVGDSYVVIISE